MAETKQAGQDAVTSVSGTDLVMCHVNGAYHPIKVSNLINALNQIGNVFLASTFPSQVMKNSWVRVAKSLGNQFSGLISVDCGYNGNIPPKAAFIALGGYNATWGNLKADWINASESIVSAVRFVKDGTTCYIEVKFNNDKTSYFYVSLGHNNNMALIPATVSNADTSNVLKTIEFSGGGVYPT